MSDEVDENFSRYSCCHALVDRISGDNFLASFAKCMRGNFCIGVRSPETDSFAMGMHRWPSIGPLTHDQPCP
jgi:hypothetical protein